MKNLKAFIAAALVCVAMPMSAQFYNTSSKTSTTTDSPESYSRLSVGYLSTSSSGKYSKIDDGDSPTLSGIAAQYTMGKKISDSSPIYLEYGIRANWSTYSFDAYDYDDVTITKVSASIPVSVGYRFDASENFAIMPYTGLHLTGNIIGKLSNDDDSVDMFDKDEVGNKDLVWNRIQYGWQIGANFMFNKFSIGIEYSIDFGELYKKCDTSDLMLSIGFNL